MAILDKLQQVGQGVVRGTKELTDTTRLRSQIAEEQRQIANFYAQIGKTYYETVEPEADSPIGALCQAIKAAQERIEKYEEDILQIKGTRRCPVCNANVPIADPFCGSCGAKHEVPVQAEPVAAAKKFCTGCGSEISPGSGFCTICGQKQA